MTLVKKILFKQRSCNDSDPVETPKMLDTAFERFFQSGKEGVTVLSTSQIKEWVHLKSDVNTPNSLYR